MLFSIARMRGVRIMMQRQVFLNVPPWAQIHCSDSGTRMTWRPICLGSRRSLSSPSTFLAEAVCRDVCVAWTVPLIPDDTSRRYFPTMERSRVLYVPIRWVGPPIVLLCAPYQVSLEIQRARAVSDPS